MLFFSPKKLGWKIHFVFSIYNKGKPQSQLCLGSIWDRAAGCQGDHVGGFGLSRTGYPVETSAASVAWQQSPNTPLSSCIMSQTKTQTIKMPTWENARFCPELRSAEVCTEEQVPLARAPRFLEGGQQVTLVRSFSKTMTRTSALWLFMQKTCCFSLHVRWISYKF